MLDDPKLALSSRHAGRFVEVGDRRVFVAEHGRGVPVVALHAIAHGSGDFDALASRLGGDHRFFLVDWPGHGRSDRSTKPTARDYAALLEGLVPALTDEPVVLVGNSIGGAAALAFAARVPERVRGLVLCDSGGLAPIGAFARLGIGAFARFFEAGARGASWFPALYRRYYALVLSGDSAADRRARIVAAGRAMAPILAEAWRGFATPEFDLRALPATIRAPVWCAWAKHDRTIPWRSSRAACQRFVDREVTLFDGGHSPFLEDPDRFADGFARFVARVA